MTNRSIVEELDKQIEVLLADGDCTTPADRELSELLAVAGCLEMLPDPDFKLRLKAELLEQAATTNVGEAMLAGSTSKRPTSIGMRRPRRSSDASAMLPTLFSEGYGVYPVQRSSFMASALAHVAALALLVTVGILAARNADDQPKVHSVMVSDIGSYLLPAATDRSEGGGGGGDRDKLVASKGNPPRFAFDQIVPPAIIVRDENPKLTADPTVVGPPNLSFPPTNQMGDPLSSVLGTTSNGTGSSGGVGIGSDGGVGPGRGPGAGPGSGGGFGDGIYHVGGRVSTPRAIYDPEPEYSEEARRVKHQGMVILSVVIGRDGRPQDIRIARSLGMGLDEKALEAVRHWRFEPALKDGQPVAVLVNIEVNFRLY